jgi:hypothetical protein
MVSIDEEGYASIFLNARHSYEHQRKSLRHALRHLSEDDFHNDSDIQTIEARADGLEVARKETPKLIKASELLPPPPPPKPKFQPSPHQLAVLRRCIADLDTFLFNDRYEY